MNTNSKKILVVDDEAINRFILNKQLTKAGYEVYEAEHGEGALALLANEPGINCVLLDLNMPVMDGYGFLYSVEHAVEYANRELQVIIISASHESTFLEGIRLTNVKAVHVKGYMQKPVNMAVLLPLIEQTNVTDHAASYSS